MQQINEEQDESYPKAEVGIMKTRECILGNVISVTGAILLGHPGSMERLRIHARIVFTVTEAYPICLCKGTA